MLITCSAAQASRDAREVALQAELRDTHDLLRAKAGRVQALEVEVATEAEAREELRRQAELNEKELREQLMQTEEAVALGRRERQQLGERVAQV